MPQRSLIERIRLWTPPVAYMAVIFYMSSKSQPVPEITTLVWDKLLHALEYGVLAVLFCRALAAEGLTPLRTAIAAVVLTAIYAATDEWHQGFVALRWSEPADWLADAVGAALGAAGHALVRPPSKV